MHDVSAADPDSLSVALPARAATAPGRRHSLAERLRKPVSLVAVVAFACAVWQAEPSMVPALRLLETGAGFALAVAAGLGRLWCAVYIAGRKNTELCALGPYSLCRNPLYVFSSFGVAGIVLATHRSGLALLGFAAFWTYYVAVVRGEEVRLAHLFGNAFADYRARVPRFWPRWRGYADTATLVVRLQPLRRAFAEIAWFFAAWFAAHVVFAGR